MIIVWGTRHFRKKKAPSKRCLADHPHKKVKQHFHFVRTFAIVAIMRNRVNRLRN